MLYLPTQERCDAIDLAVKYQDDPKAVIAETDELTGALQTSVRALSFAGKGHTGVSLQGTHRDVLGFGMQEKAGWKD